MLLKIEYCAKNSSIMHNNGLSRVSLQLHNNITQFTYRLHGIVFRYYFMHSIRILQYCKSLFIRERLYFANIRE